RELIAAGVAQHVSMGLDTEISRHGSSLDHAGEARCREGCVPLRNEHEWRAVALALMLAECPQLTAGQRMAARGAILDSTGAQDCRFEVHLLPTKVNHFGRA